MAGMTMDVHVFKLRLTDLQRRLLPQAALVGVARAGMALLNDSLQRPPTPPIQTGRLRESGSMIAGTTVQTTPQHGHGTPCTDPQPQAPGKAVALVGFNTPYAAKVHNVPMNFREPDSGNHYLQGKMRNYREDYMAVAGKAIKNELGM